MHYTVLVQKQHTMIVEPDGGCMGQPYRDNRSRFLTSLQGTNIPLEILMLAAPPHVMYNVDLSMSKTGYKACRRR